MLGPCADARDQCRQHPSVIRSAGVSRKKPFALRLNQPVMQAMQRWADDDLRSLNAQIEWVLRQALKKNGRLKPKRSEPVEDSE